MRPKVCIKTMHPTRGAAFHAHSLVRHNSPWPTIVVYRCEECRFGDGKRAWHWGHNRPRIFGRRP